MVSHSKKLFIRLFDSELTSTHYRHSDNSLEAIFKSDNAADVEGAGYEVGSLNRLLTRTMLSRQFCK